MEILSNFSSIYYFISFILGAVFMLATLCIVAMGKDEEPRNNVHFYVARDRDDNTLYIYLGKPRRDISYFYPSANGSMIAIQDNFSNFGLDEKDFDNLKFEDEPVEVFLNLED